jgi:hypothetical protein
MPHEHEQGAPDLLEASLVDPQERRARFRDGELATAARPASMLPPPDYAGCQDLVLSHYGLASCQNTMLTDATAP